MGSIIRGLIKPEEIADRFSARSLEKYAGDFKFPAATDIAILSRGIRTAVEIYIDERSLPNQNQQFKEIQNLFKAARLLFSIQAELTKQRSYPFNGAVSKKINTYILKAALEAAALSEQLSNLSNATIVLLANRGKRFVKPILLPSPKDLVDSSSYHRVCSAIFSLCSMGRGRRKKRNRPTGRKSETVEIDFFAPSATRHPPKRQAEINFIMWVQIAWLEATKEEPTLSASFENPGPFVRLIKHCFSQAGADYANAVELINELNHRRIDARTQSAQREK